MPDETRERAGIDLRGVVDRALDALAPAFLRIVEDQAVSFEHALHVVVMDPAAAPATAPFESAILAQRSFGAPQGWEADYAHYARAKARLAWREGMTTAALVEDAPARLRAGDLVIEGAVCRHGLVVAASGAQPWFDAACAGMVVELVHAFLRDAVNGAREKGGTW